MDTCWKPGISGSNMNEHWCPPQHGTLVEAAVDFPASCRPAFLVVCLLHTHYFAEGAKSVISPLFLGWQFIKVHTLTFREEPNWSLPQQLSGTP